MGARIGFVLFFLYFFIPSNVFSQDNPLDRKVSLHLQFYSTAEILQEIEQEAPVNFAYNPDMLPHDNNIRIDVDNVDIRDVLEEIFNGKVQYKPVGRHIILTPEKKPSSVSANKSIVSGQVLERLSGEPVEFALVYDINTLKNVQTDALGNFMLEASAKSGQVELSISRKNYVDTVLVFEPENNLTQLNLKLEPLKSTSPLSIDTTYVPIRPVEEISLVKFALSEKQKELMAHVDEQSLYQVFQLSLLPFVGTNRQLSGKVTNNISINIIGGYASGLSGLEIGTFNIIRHEAKGLQAGGFGNIVGGRYSGIQVGGFFNFVANHVNGIQFAGFSNTAFRSMNGAQISGFVNSAGSLSGWQAAGFLNFSYRSAGGVQMAGFLNVNGSGESTTQMSGFANFTGQTSGFQGAGFINFTLNDMSGLQMAGFSNVTYKNLKGVQLSGFMNLANLSFTLKPLRRFMNKRFNTSLQINPNESDSLDRKNGTQIAGFLNVNFTGKSNGQVSGFMNLTGRLSGIQATGLVNLTAKEMHGLQLGFLNIAGKVKGVQLGFLNIAGDMKGVPVGFLSFVKNGYHALELATGDFYQANVSLKTGVRHFYNILYFGKGKLEGNYLRGYGYGIGLISPLIKDRLSFSGDLISKSVTVNSWTSSNIILNTTLNPLINYRLFNILTIFAGPSFHHLIIDASSPHLTLLERGKPLESSSMNYRQFFWPGFRAGIRLN